jgi:sortase A
MILRKIISVIAVILMITSVGIFSYLYYIEYTENKEIATNVVKAEEIIAKSLETENNQTLQQPEVNNTVLPQSEKKIKIKTQNELLQEGSIIGIVEIPKYGRRSAIVQGIETNSLKTATGKYPDSGMPGENRQIFLAGHNNREFSILGNLVNGDKINIITKYGKYEYKIYDSKIVNRTDVSVLNYDNLGEDQVVLMTCYPFNYYLSSDAPERYLVYAKPIK